MSEKLKRAQILLELEQHRLLSVLSKQTGISISGLIREAVAEYLTSQNAETRKEQRLNALEALDKIREEVKRKHGVYQGGIINDIREERMKQLEEVEALWEQWS